MRLIVDQEGAKANNGGSNLSASSVETVVQWLERLVVVQKTWVRFPLVSHAWRLAKCREYSVRLTAPALQAY